MSSAASPIEGVEPWLTIPLEQTAGGSFHTREGAVKQAQEQHSTMIDYGARLIVQAELGDVVHGYMNENGDAATLLVISFRFLSPSRQRRFRQAEIEVQFNDQLGRHDHDPEVVRVAPDGHFQLNPTTRLEETSVSAGVGIQGGPATGFISVGAQATWERRKTLEFTDATSLTGSRHRRGRNYGAMNTMRLVMDENPGQKDGVPSQLRGLVMLKRDAPDAPFLMQLRVKTVVDVRYRIGELLQTWVGSRIKADPVCFDPNREPARGLRGSGNVWDLSGLDRNNLADVNLAELCNLDITNP
ncbi:hypothetical protein G7Y89_g13235 [Cudoniella acicularis]|uniref:Uncharacterized protein n=1 Tax=Cudoniella acicularis TaxID=354080 RepID=A0A8H4RB46_9HELO|nr:hypothetical protein G7Y89_g13235 [Cudoniella acicularis]